MPKRSSFATLNPLALTNVEDALKALRQAFRAPDATPTEEQAIVAGSEPPSSNVNNQT